METILINLLAALILLIVWELWIEKPVRNVLKTLTKTIKILFTTVSEIKKAVNKIIYKD